MLKETEQTLRLVVIIFIIDGISIREGQAFCPSLLGYTYDVVGS